MAKFCRMQATAWSTSWFWLLLRRSRTASDSSETKLLIRWNISLAVRRLRISPNMSSTVLAG
ncbi:hypothetical protein D3C75_806330 [compost metagenome]